MADNDIIIYSGSPDYSGDPNSNHFTVLSDNELQMYSSTGALRIQTDGSILMESESIGNQLTIAPPINSDLRSGDGGDVILVAGDAHGYGNINLKPNPEYVKQSQRSALTELFQTLAKNQNWDRDEIVEILDEVLCNEIMDS